MTRASDSEREAAVDRLRAAHLEGRIDEEELEQRVGRAHAARTLDELAAVTHDLPRRRAEPATTSGLPRVPGRRHFDERKLLDGPPVQVRATMLRDLVPVLERHGFYVQREADDGLTLASRREMASRVTVRLHDGGHGRTLAHAHGYAPLAVRRVFAALTS